MLETYIGINIIKNIKIIFFITFIFRILRCKFKKRNPIRSIILFTFCLFFIIFHYKQQSKQKVNFHNYVAQIEKTLFHVT